MAAFRATLEEVTGADVIVHVRDIASDATQAQKTQVLDVLAELGIVEGEGGATTIPIIEAWNKVDLLDRERSAELAAIAADDQDAVLVSALTGDGVDDLLGRVDALLTSGARSYEIALPSGDGRRLAWLHRHGQIMGERAAHADGEPATLLTVRLTPKEYGRFQAL
ncbi:hypothetical protein J4558_10045 [Leptolyngbya sp. 15MV]|nr:hypothetical protein J4558_10045 [Leptolyngbya sp. 15MV]